jgi:hypothetical protein
MASSDICSPTTFPIVLTYTTYHCGMCRGIVSGICRSHPTAKVVSVENYTDGRPPSNPWNGKKAALQHLVAYLPREVDLAQHLPIENNGHTVHGTTEVAEKPSKTESRQSSSDSQQLPTTAKGKRGRQKGAKKCSKCQRFHLEGMCIL